MGNFEKELENLTAKERSAVIDKLQSELSYEQSQLVRDVIMQRANNVPYATVIQDAIEKYVGKSVTELASMFNLNANSKSINRNIISHILEIEGLNENQDRFSKEMIKIKSVTLNDKNKFNNGMSLNPFSFEGIVNEQWETSSLRVTFKKNIFLFVIFKEKSPTNIVLEKCVGWTIDNNTLDTKIKEIWEIVKSNLVNGKVISFIDINKRMKTTFPSTTFNGVCFVAAHAHSKKDTSKLPVPDKLTGITDLTKHSFWLTKDFLYEILDITNDISLKNAEHDDIRVPLGFDTTDDSVIIGEDSNKTDATHISEEIKFDFNEEINNIDDTHISEEIDFDLGNDTKIDLDKGLDLNFKEDSSDSIDDLLASLKRDKPKPEEVDVIEDPIELEVTDKAIEEHTPDVPDEIDLGINLDFNFDDEDEDEEDTSIEDFLNSTVDTSPKPEPKPAPKPSVSSVHDPIVDRFSGTESVETLTARLESNLRKLEAEYSSGLGTLSASGKYSLRGRIEKRVATEMNDDILSYEHSDANLDPKAKKKMQKQLKKAAKKQKK